MILKKYFYPTFTVISLALIDNLTKYYVRVENIQELVVIENFLTIDLTYNTGDVRQAGCLIASHGKTHAALCEKATRAMGLIDPGFQV